MLEFLALAKAQGHLVLLALEVRRRAKADLWWEAQTPHGLLKTLLVGAELRIPLLAQDAAHAVELLWARKLRLSQQGWHAEPLQQASRAAGVALADLVDISRKFPRSIGADFEPGKESQQGLTVLCVILPNPQGRLEWQGALHHGSLQRILQGGKPTVGFQGVEARW